jgi:hypothetical protein
MEIPKLTQNQCLVLYSSFFERDHMGGENGMTILRYLKAKKRHLILSKV